MNSISRSPSKSNDNKQDVPQISVKCCLDSSAKNNNSSNSFDSACYCTDSDKAPENTLADVGNNLHECLSSNVDRYQDKTKDVDAIHPSNHEWDSKTTIDRNLRVASSCLNHSENKTEDKAKTSTLRSYTEFKQRAKTRGNF